MFLINGIDLSCVGQHFPLVDYTDKQPRKHIKLHFGLWNTKTNGQSLDNLLTSCQYWCKIWSAFWKGDQLIKRSSKYCSPFLSVEWKSDKMTVKLSVYCGCTGSAVGLFFDSQKCLKTPFRDISFTLLFLRFGDCFLSLFHCLTFTLFTT